MGVLNFHELAGGHSRRRRFMAAWGDDGTHKDAEDRYVDNATGMTYENYQRQYGAGPAVASDGTSSLNTDYGRSIQPGVFIDPPTPTSASSLQAAIDRSLAPKIAAQQPAQQLIASSWVADHKDSRSAWVNAAGMRADGTPGVFDQATSTPTATSNSFADALKKALAPKVTLTQRADPMTFLNQPKAAPGFFEKYGTWLVGAAAVTVAGVVAYEAVAPAVVRANPPPLWRKKRRKRRAR